MLHTVSPVMVGAVAAPPHPTMPPSVSRRTSTFSALVTSSNAILSGFTIGTLPAKVSMRMMFTRRYSGKSVSDKASQMKRVEQKRSFATHYLRRIICDAVPETHFSKLSYVLDRRSHALVVGLEELLELRRVAIVWQDLDV